MAKKRRRAKKGALRVWWIPQVPGEAFHVRVKSVEQAKFTITLLADYDQFQLDQRVKGDYSNAGGLQMWDGEEWTEWYSEDGEDIDEVMEAA